MSTLGDALAALKNVVLMQERLDVMKADFDRMSGDMRGLNDYAVSLDKRLVRLETVVEVASGRLAPDVPRIEG